MPVVHLTDLLIRSFTKRTAEAEVLEYMDRGFKGFGVRVKAGRVSFFVRADGRRYRETLGRYGRGRGEITLAAARKLGHEVRHAREAFRHAGGVRRRRKGDAPPLDRATTWSNSTRAPAGELERQAELEESRKAAPDSEDGARPWPPPGYRQRRKG